jgi:energy-coupling factor transporter ATP-binding protein EcfA2
MKNCAFDLINNANNKFRLSARQVKVREESENKLSPGQRQRFAVAGPLPSKPKFVLADEPNTNLNSKSTKKLLDITKELNKKNTLCLF